MEGTRMTLTEFAEEMKFYLSNEFGCAEEDIRFLPAGMVGDNDADAQLIKDTNRRFFDSDAEVLQGSFLVVRGSEPEGPQSPSAPGGRAIQRFFVDAMYQEYKANGFEAALKGMRQSQEQRKLAESSDTLQRLDTYEGMRERLIVRPLYFKTHRNELRNYVYRREGDFALVLYMTIAHQGGNYMTSKCPKAAFEKWGKPADEVLDAALVNTCRLHPPKLYRLNRLADVDHCMEDLGPIEDVAGIENIRFLTLTGEDNPNGAISLFFPGVMSRLREKIGADYYVVFTSIAEAAIHSTKNNDARTLLHSLRDMNNNLNTPEEVMSTHVFKCNGQGLEQMVL